MRGDGQCFPARRNCNFLQLKPGHKASLDYAPERDRTYNLKLRQIKLVPISKSQGGGSHKIAPPPSPPSPTPPPPPPPPPPRGRCWARTAEPTPRAPRLQEPRSTSLGLAVWWQPFDSPPPASGTAQGWSPSSRACPRASSWIASGSTARWLAASSATGAEGG